jgi:hypothetical protein
MQKESKFLEMRESRVRIARECTYAPGLSSKAEALHTSRVYFSRGRHGHQHNEEEGRKVWGPHNSQGPPMAPLALIDILNRFFSAQTRENLLTLCLLLLA